MLERFVVVCGTIDQEAIVTICSERSGKGVTVIVALV